MQTTKNLSQPAFVLAVLLAFLTAGLQAQQLDQRFEVAPGGLLTVRAEGGSIEVKSGDSARVEVEIIPRDVEKFQKRYKVEFNQSGNNVSVVVESVNKASNWFNRGKGYKIVASVPFEFDTDLKTSGGGVQVSDLKGEVKAATSGGSLQLGKIEGTIWGRTSGGSIEVDQCTGETSVHTSGGGIVIGEVEGVVDAVTSGGPIRIKYGGGDIVAKTSGGGIEIEEVKGSLDASTSGGSVEATFTNQPAGDCRLSTSGGNVTVWIGSNLGFEVDAKTSGGRVRTDLPISVRGTLGKDRVEGQLNQGGPNLVLRTSGGNISINAASER